MDTVYSVTEVAKQLKVSIETVRRLIRSKKLPAAKFGNKYRISEEDLKKFLESLKEQ